MEGFQGAALHSVVAAIVRLDHAPWPATDDDTAWRALADVLALDNSHKQICYRRAAAASEGGFLKLHVSARARAVLNIGHCAFRGSKQPGPKSVSQSRLNVAALPSVVIRARGWVPCQPDPRVEPKG